MGCNLQESHYLFRCLKLSSIVIIIIINNNNNNNNNSIENKNNKNIYKKLNLCI